MVGMIKTHYISRGTEGPVVVLIHGFGSSTHTWRKTMEALGGKYRVFALDMKGFGLTAKPLDGEYHPRVFAEHLHGFLDVMKIEKAVLVGHSLGGAVAARFAVRHPERVQGLVLVAAAPSGWGRGGDVAEVLNEPVGLENVRRQENGAPGPAGRSGVIAGLASRVLPALLRATMTRERVEAGLRGSFHDPSVVTEEMIDVYHRPILIEGSAEALAAMVNPPPSAYREELPPLATLNVPTMITTGRHDKIVPRIVAEQYAQAWPHARRIVFEHSGHMPHEEEAPAFEAALFGFLDQIPRQDKTPDVSKKTPSVP